MTREEFNAETASMAFKLVLEEDGGVRWLRLSKACHVCGGHQHALLPRIQEDLTNPEVLDILMHEIRERDCGHGLPPGPARP